MYLQKLLSQSCLYVFHAQLDQKNVPSWFFCPLKTTTLPPSLVVEGGREGGRVAGTPGSTTTLQPRSFSSHWHRFYRSEQRFTIGCNQSLCTLVNQWEAIKGSPTNNYRVFYFLHSRADAEVGLRCESDTHIYLFCRFQLIDAFLRKSSGAPDHHQRWAACCVSAWWIFNPQI